MFWPSGRVVDCNILILFRHATTGQVQWFSSVMKFIRKTKERRLILSSVHAMRFAGLMQILDRLFRIMILCGMGQVAFIQLLTENGLGDLEDVCFSKNSIY